MEFVPGDTFAIAMLRSGLHPGGGGCLCLAGDCPNCLCVVDGEAYVRSCQRKAEAGSTVDPQPVERHPVAPQVLDTPPLAIQHVHADVVVVGLGDAGRAEVDAARAAGRTVVSIDAANGEEAIGVYPGPVVAVGVRGGMLHVHPREIVVATGSAEGQPACPGNDLAGLFTARGAAAAHAAGVDLGRIVALGEPPTGVPCEPIAGRPVRFEGSGRVESVVVRDEDGTVSRHACHTVSLGLDRYPRDALARMLPTALVRVVGEAAVAGALPPAPDNGVVCRCAGVTVEDLRSIWERGFDEIELLKRASLAGTGTCQGTACLPHLRAFLAERGREPSPPAFTARPVARQPTIEQVASGARFDPVRRTSLDGEHRRLGARMERSGGWWRPWSYADPGDEYRAVRERVSLFDVGTLGKLVVAGPGAGEFLERLYPCPIADLADDEVRYALLLDERGYVLDDGTICRDGERRFFLTFSTAGATTAEMWMRDWAETWGSDVRILDRTAALSAINVTGPLAHELLSRVTTGALPSYLHTSDVSVVGIACRAIRLGFTGEVSFELHHSASRSAELWSVLLDHGADLGIAPHGLDTLLTLRLEKGHVIVGMDTELDSTPRRLGMGWNVDRSKPFFVGQDALELVDALPLDRRLVGFEIDGDPPPDGAVLKLDGTVVGHLTSARWSPAGLRTVALGWLRLVDGALPPSVRCDDREARRVPVPFYDREGLRARA